jgi:hypothetical protein
MIKKHINKAVDFYARKPIISLIILLIILILWDLIILPFTKKSKVITVKVKTTSNMVGRYRSATMNYVIVDENGTNYTYDYNYLLQLLKLQTGRYNDYFDIKEGSQMKVTYYGLVTHTILDVEKV